MCEMLRCVLCGRCVRACKDLRGIGVLQYNKAKLETYVGTLHDKLLTESDCRFCGACAEVCPTGAIHDVVDFNAAEKRSVLLPCTDTCPAHTDIPGRDVGIGLDMAKQFCPQQVWAMSLADCLTTPTNTGDGIRLGMDICLALVILLVGRKVIQFLQKIINRSFERSNMDVSIRKFLTSLTKAALYAVLISIIAATLGLDTTSFIAVLGSAGLAVGLALQGSLANFAGGVLLIILKPFSVGDYIVAVGVEGTVEAIDLFYTALLTVDNKRITIPNGTLANSTVVNVTMEKERRLDISVTVDYQTDLKKVKDILAGILNDRENIIKDKETIIYVDSFGEAGLILGLRVWVGKDDFFAEKFAIMEQIKHEFDAQGILSVSRKLGVRMEQ